MITKKTIEEVFETAKIEDVVGDFLNLKRYGSNLKGLCPFHDEKTPSFMVSPTKNIFKCFGCGEGGGPVQFVMEHEKYSYPEAIRYLAGKYGIKIEETESSPEEKQLFQEVESLHLVNKFAQEVFVRNLHETDEGRQIGMSYFKERGYLESTIKKFELGYADKSYTSLKEEALKLGFKEDRLKTLGLVTRNDNDFFRGRVIFPIHNLSGRVIGFGARILKQGPRDPKYLNSSESSVYNKRKVLYGMHLAKHAIRKLDACFLVEGYTDVISLYQSGIENVVASSGTALTKEQIKSIKRFTSNITVLYDGDAAGVKAAMRGLDLMLEENIDVRLVLLPDNNDPDSLVKSLGHQGFLDFLVAESKDFILFKTGFLSEESKNDPIARTRVTRDIVDSIALIPDTIKRSNYIRECANQLEIEESILIDEVNRSIKANLKKLSLRRRENEVRTDFDIISQQRPLQKAGQSKEKIVSHSDEHQERSIIRILVMFGELTVDPESGQSMAEYVISNISDVLDTFANPLYARIIEHYTKALDEGTAPTRESLISQSDPEISRLVVEFVAPPYEYSENWEIKKQMPLTTQKPPEENFVEDSYQSILRFKLKKIQLKITENKVLVQALAAENDAEKLNIQLKVHVRLKAMKSELESKVRTIGIRL
ncbi:MAG: DNA primase [Bacteroidetes bacterium]|nr:MAG: DNA primase [Bacteroidota bacterium]